MNSKKIIIPDIECMSDEHYEELLDILNSIPINYQVWECTNIE